MIESKLPEVGTSIFSVMSKMAAEHNAINMSQGFPEFDVDPNLIELVYGAMKEGNNQYAPMPGIPQLRQAIANKIKKTHGRVLDPDKEITVTAGASEALFSSIQALIKKGDEVVVFEPAYDLYKPAVELAGGSVMPIKLDVEDFSIPWDEVWDKISSKTKMIIINSPHNPSGAILKKDDIQQLKNLITQKNLYLLSDEVYEHIIFDGEHLSPLSEDDLSQYCISVYSFGKTFHATGWKIGYVVASSAIMAEIRKVHQYNSFSIHTPTQHALATFLEDEQNYSGIGQLYKEKKDHFADALKSSNLRLVPSFGTYFQLVDYTDVTDMPAVDFAEKLTKENGLASVPISVFYTDDFDPKILRFCFAKNEDTLTKAADILCRI